jgi:hypothetical protein
MSISTYYRPNIHQNGPEILGFNHQRLLFPLIDYIHLQFLNSDHSIWQARVLPVHRDSLASVGCA